MRKAKRRQRDIARLRRYLLSKRSPRAEMLGVLVVTGLTGFVASASMLYLGLTDMWLRYPVAATLAYGFFLLMVTGLVSLYQEGTGLGVGDLADTLTDLADLVPEGAALDSPPAGATGDGIDLGFDGFDGDEGCLIVAIVALVLGLLTIAVYVVLTAPTLLAELLLDSLLIGGLYRRLRKSAPDNLYIAAFRRTWLSALLTLLLLAATGAVFESYAPEAVSIGSVFAKWSATH